MTQANAYIPRMFRRSKGQILGKKFDHKVNPAGTKVAAKCAARRLTVR
jgi:hypothetical protein